MKISRKKYRSNDSATVLCTIWWFSKSCAARRTQIPAKWQNIKIYNIRSLLNAPFLVETKCLKRSEVETERLSKSKKKRCCRSIRFNFTDKTNGTLHDINFIYTNNIELLNSKAHFTACKSHFSKNSHVFVYCSVHSIVNGEIRCRKKIIIIKETNA